VNTANFSHEQTLFMVRWTESWWRISPLTGMAKAANKEVAGAIRLKSDAPDRIDQNDITPACRFEYLP